MRLALILASLALLCGCGQKGPLYLPQKKPAVVSPAPPAPPAPSAAGAPPKKPTDQDGDSSPQP
jgi:predicted small lipoprotein YifL